MSSVRGAVVGGVLAVVLISAAVVTLVLTARERPPALATISSEQPVLVPVSATTSDEAVQTTATLTVDDPFSVLAPTTGVVTLVPVQTGARAAPGDTLVEIDGEPLIAYVAEAPLYRQLDVGDEGRDVAQLQRFLDDVVGTDGAVDGVFGVSTADAVERLRARAGMSTGSSIGPEQLGWIGEGRLDVRAVPVRVGDRVTEETVIVQGPPRRVDLSVAADLSGFGAAPLLLTIGTTTVPVASGGTVDETGRTNLLAAEGAFEQRPAVVTLAEPIEFAQIPATAVMTGDDGRTCIVMANGDTTPVTVASSSFGRSRLVESADELPDEVVGNPQVLRDRC